MKKTKTLLFVLATLLLICCACTPQAQTRDPWAYAEPDGTWREENRKAYLDVMYLYENLRPNEALTEEQLAASTDEQWLRLSDERYRDLDQEAYMARASELQYEDMKPIALAMIEDYHIADRAPDLCFSYLRPVSFTNSTHRWYTSLIYEDGYAYSLHINTNDGSFQCWIRRPQGYWTTFEHGVFTEAVEGPERTDEELQNAAKAYIESAPAFKDAEIVEISTVTYPTSAYVIVGIRPEQVYRIFIDRADLSVSAVERTL